MCGIVGLVAKPLNGLQKQHEDSFFQMLYADALRGEDSTGVIGVENDTTFHIAKEACSAEWFISRLKTAPAKEINVVNPVYNRGKAWIGHNRKKTSGAIKDETAHPFVIDETFAMVHNGTLWNHSQLAKTEVDSEALAIHLHKAFEAADGKLDKLKLELEESLSQVNGAYALVIYDQKHHRVHLLRNKERPLFLIETDNAWYFMSEPLMGAWILCRNGYKYDTLKAELVEEHMLITFDLDSTKIIKEQLTPKKSYTPSSNSVSWGVGTRGTRTGEIQTTNVTSGKNGTFLTEAKDLRRFRKAWLGKRISFWPDDHLEKNFPRTVDEDGETEVVIMGGHEEISYAHTIMAEVDLAKVGIRYSFDITAKKWSGVIDSITTTNTGVVHIWLREGTKPHLASIAPAPTPIAEAISKSAKESVIWRENIGRMLTEELNEYYETHKHKLDNWQVTAINCEIAFRVGIRDVEHAAKIAKERDHCVLEQKVIKGKFVYVNNDGRIYYETSIAVH